MQHYVWLKTNMKQIIAVLLLSASALYEVVAGGKTNANQQALLKASTVFNFHTKKSGTPLVIESPSHATKCTSYLLAWKLRHPDQPSVSAYYIKYKSAKRKPVQNDWKYVVLLGNATNYTITGLEHQTLYQVEIISEQENMVLSRPAMSSFRTGCVKNISIVENAGVNVTTSKTPARRHAAPQAPSLAVTDTSRTSISLMWYPTSNGGSPVEGYKVQMKSLGRRHKGWKSKWVPADTRTYDFTGLKKGLDYKFRVIAVNNMGESPPSQSARFRSQQQNHFPQLPMPPEISHAYIKQKSTICIVLKDWDLQSDADGYILFVAQNDVELVEQRFQSTFNQEICADVEFKSGYSYKVKMQSFAAQGTSPFSNELHFKIPAEFKENMLVLENSDDYDETSLNPHEKDPSSSFYSPLKEMSQRDIAILLAGATLLFVIVVLSISAIVYHNMLRRNKQNEDENEEETSCFAKKATGHTCQSKKAAKCQYQRNCSDSKADVGICVNQPHYRRQCYNCDINCGPPASACPVQHSEPMWWLRDGEVCHIIPRDTQRSQHSVAVSQVPFQDEHLMVR